MSTITHPEIIQKKIHVIRSQRVMLDKDLADLYHVKPIALRQQVKRNKGRFPNDFMFTLMKSEVEILVSQNVIPSLRSLGGYLPYAFTEQGVAMLSSVLKNRRAVKVNVMIMRVFTKIRELIDSQKDIIRRINMLEMKYDAQFKIVFDEIRRTVSPKIKNGRLKIGFGKN